MSALQLLIAILLILLSAVQGLGAGGINSLTQIILSDLVPLKDRGKFNGLVAMCDTFIPKYACN